MTNVHTMVDHYAYLDGLLKGKDARYVSKGNGCLPTFSCKHKGIEATKVFVYFCLFIENLGPAKENQMLQTTDGSNLIV